MLQALVCPCLPKTDPKAEEERKKKNAEIKRQRQEHSHQQHLADEDMTIQHMVESPRVVDPLDKASQDLKVYESTYNSLDDPEIECLLANNERWISKVNAKDATFFERLGRGQSPKFLYFGCSDSRVPANQILGLKPGEVFVHRNVGNLVPANDTSSNTVLEYAVGVLDVHHIVVTGHYDCGAVKASMEPKDHGAIEGWVRNIRDVHRLHDHKLSEIADPEERKLRLVELNVIEQCLNIYKTSIVQRRRLQVYEEGKSPFVYPRIHGLVFNPKTGRLHKLPINFGERVEAYKHIYNLYDVHNFPHDRPAAK